MRISQNGSCGNTIYRFGLGIVRILTLLLAGLLFVSSFLTTCYADNMETQQVLFRLDNPLWNLLELAGFCLLFCGCLYFYDKFGEKFRRGLLFFTLGLIFCLGVLLILFGRTVPAADAMSVYNAALEWIQGNRDVIHPTVSYLSYYPQQIGLMAFLELLLRIWNFTGISAPAWHFIKLLYVCLLCVAVLFQYLSLKYLWRERWEEISCCYLILVCCNLPMVMYSSFVYGEIPSYAALSVGLYLLLRLLSGSFFADPVAETETRTIPPARSHSTVSAILTGAGCILFLTLSVMLRKNSLIPIIAVLLVLLFEALRSGRSVRMRLCLCGMAICLAVTSVSILPLVQKSYEKKAGNTLSSGVTAMSYFAMGMQEASRGCGWYNGFNIDTYDAAGMDTDAANEISHQAIRERLAYFREHPGYAVNFYVHKHLSQWADGTYASRQATLATYGGRSEFFQEIYDGSLSSAYIEWGNAWQNVLYLGTLLFCVNAVRRRRKGADAAPQNGGADSLYLYIGLIAVLGGFLFHILWEANSRYIFLYSLLMMPYCAAGVQSGGRIVMTYVARVGAKNRRPASASDADRSGT